MASRPCFVFFFLYCCAVAQSVSDDRSVQVMIGFSNGKCDASAHVRLTGHDGPIVEAVPDQECLVSFARIPDGTYDVRVYGRTFVDSESTITISRGSTNFEIEVAAGDQFPKTNAMVSSASVSVSDLRVPEKARRELEKANKQIQQLRFAKAIRTLHQAIDLYPSYADAYNNLGVVYGRIGDRDHERQALEKAVTLDDHLAPAYANLGLLGIVTGDLGKAELAFKKAVDCDPLNGTAFTFLAFSQFLEKKADQAIETARQAHALHSSHAYAHRIAAGAFEQKRDISNAMSELKVFLQEEPTGPRADSAREELTALQSTRH